MRIGLIADVHGNAPAFQAVLTVLLKRVDLVLFAGDLVGYYPFVNECVNMWDPEVMVGIRGNHDEILLQSIKCGTPPGPDYLSRYGSALERSWQSSTKPTLNLLQSWPIRRSLIVSSVSVSMFHGAPWDPLEGRVYPDFREWERFDDCQSDVVVLGHTHYPLFKRYKDKLIVNPGSVGQARDQSGKASWAELDVGLEEVQHYRIPYDNTRIIQDALRHDPDVPYLVEVLTR
jgi:putative phosphoesterase